VIILCIFNINYILLEISGSHSNIISDSYVFHYGNELVSCTGNKEIRHFVTTNYNQKYPFAHIYHLATIHVVSFRPVRMQEQRLQRLASPPFSKSAWQRSCPSGHECEPSQRISDRASSAPVNEIGECLPVSCVEHDVSLIHEVSFTPDSVWELVLGCLVSILKYFKGVSCFLFFSRVKISK